MKSIYFSLLMTLVFGFVQAQQTGSFQLNVDFNEPDYDFTRTLYFHVPADYDAGQSYPLVVGFRGGPHSNAGQFRDQLEFLADSINAIILCPENSSHFWNEEGQTKQLFRYSLDTTMAMYNIDLEGIYLTGLSYGGRHAVIVAMDTDDGEIPGIRGVIPFAAGTDSQLQPNYEAVDQFAPACICIGLSDSDNFINVANQLHNDLQNNGADVLLNEISGVGHTVAFPSYPAEMMECIRFIDSFYPITSTASVEIASQVSVYPNPVADQFFLQLPGELEVEQIYFLNAQGQLLETYTASQRNFDIAAQASGIYYLVLETKGGRIVKRVVR